MARARTGPTTDSAVLLHMLVKAIPMPAVLLSPAGTIQESNQACADLLGYELAELVGLPIERILPAAELARVPLYVPQANVPGSGLAAQSIQCRCTSKSAEEVHLLLSGLVLPETNHTLLFMHPNTTQEAEPLYQLLHIIEESEDAIILVGTDLSILSWNRGASEIYFFRDSEAFGKSVLELFPVDRREYAASLFENVRQGHPLNQHECQQVRYGGLPFVASLSITSIKAGRQPGGFSFHARDVSLRRQAEERLHASEERFRQLAENIREVFWLRTAGEMLFVSSVYEHMFGRSCSSLYNDPNSFLDVVHPDDRERVEQAALRTTTPPISQFDEEYRIVLPDGAVRWIRARTFPVQGHYAEPRSTGIAEDITMRKEAEAALRISQGNLAKAQQIAKLGYWEWHLPEKRIIWSDELAYLFSQERGALPVDYESFMQRVHPEDRTRVTESLQAALTNKQPFTLTFRVVPASGLVRYLRAAGEIYEDENGRPIRVFGIAVDISDQYHAERALRESEERFRSIFEQSTLGMAILDLSGRFERVNSNLCQMLGFSEAELLNLTLNDALGPGSLAASQEQLQKLTVGEPGECTCQAEYRCKDGSTLAVLVNANCLRDQQGKPIRLVLQLQDIGELLRTQALLKQSQESLALAEQMAHLGNWNWEIGAETMIWSDETYRILGYEPGEFTPTFESSLSLMPAEDAQRFRTALVASIDTAQPLDIEVKLRRKDGQIRVVHANGVLQQEHGKARRVIGSVLDITERRRMEDQLRYSEERLRMLSEASSEAVVIHENGVIVDCNPALARMFNTSLQELVGTDVLKLIHPADRHISRKRISSRQPGQYEARGIRADGIGFPMLVTAMETTVDGKPVRVVLLQDITLRKEVEQANQQTAAREAEVQMLMLAAATYAHEINNPLTGIQATLQLLAEHPLPAKDTELAHEAIAAVQRISEVISRMLMMKDPQYRPYMNREIIDLSR